MSNDQVSHMVPIWADDTQPCQKWADPEQGQGTEHFIRGQPGKMCGHPLPSSCWASTFKAGVRFLSLPCLLCTPISKPAELLGVWTVGSGRGLVYCSLFKSLCKEEPPLEALAEGSAALPLELDLFVPDLILQVRAICSM